MCGIAGIVGGKPDKAIISAMIAVQEHRGPDGKGIWIDSCAALGHKRLKIIDLTDAGAQPMSTPDGRFNIVYNGEVYNYQEIRSQLKAITFRSNTDTEVILHAFAKWGPKCLDSFVGMFAFAIWDKHKKELFCARDRLGIKPFYYAKKSSAFLFSSEIRGLLAAGIKAEINPSILYDFLARDFYEHLDEIFFKGIYKLPAGCWMLVKNGEIKKIQQYWNLKSEVDKCKISVNAKERQEVLLSLASDSVKLNLHSDVPVGVALSGGLDSATLIALLEKTHPNPSLVEGFSFIFKEKQYSEKPFIDAMAKQTGRRVNFIKVTPKIFADTSERVCLSQEEPHAGLPISAYALCCELARKNGYIVIMDGSGMDEALAGYIRFRPAYWVDLFLAKKSKDLEKEFVGAGISTAAERKQAFSQISAFLKPGADVGRAQDLTSSVRPECISPDFAHLAERPLPRFEMPFKDHLHNLMYRELRYTKLPRALRFRDHLSMATSVEMRPPFLDHRLLGYEFALPSGDLISKGVSKAILRRAAGRFLPDLVRLASKRTVQTPQREWFRNELSDWICERIDTPSFWRRGWIDKKKGRQAIKSFLKGEGNNSFFLWQWANLEIWASHFLGKN